MTRFEGREFSTVEDEMPDHKWDQEKFSSDWETQVKEVNSYINEDDIKMAQETALPHFYDTYESLRVMIDEEELPETEKQKLNKELNLAMTNVIEFAQRSDKHILESLKARKFEPEDKHSEVFNDFIEMLMIEYSEGVIKFHEAQEKFYDKRKE